MISIQKSVLSDKEAEAIGGVLAAAIQGMNTCLGDTLSDKFASQHGCYGKFYEAFCVAER